MSTTMYRHLSSGFDWPATCCCDPPTWQLSVRPSPCHCGYRLAASGRIGRDPIPRVDLPFPGSHYIVRNGVVTWPDELRCDCKDDPNIPLGTLYLDGFVYPPPISECQGVISYSGVAVGETVTVTLTKPPPFQNKCGYVSHWRLRTEMGTQLDGYPPQWYSWADEGFGNIQFYVSGNTVEQWGDFGPPVDDWVNPSTNGGWMCDGNLSDSVNTGYKTVQTIHKYYPSDRWAYCGYKVRSWLGGRVSEDGECLGFPSEITFYNDNSRATMF